MEDIDNFKYVYQIINELDKESFEKIPKDLYQKIEKLPQKSNKTFKIDKNKKLTEQDIPYEVKVLLKYVYMATMTEV